MRPASCSWPTRPSCVAWLLFGNQCSIHTNSDHDTHSVGLDNKLRHQLKIIISGQAKEKSNLGVRGSATEMASLCLAVPFSDKRRCKRPHLFAERPWNGIDWSAKFAT